MLGTKNRTKRQAPLLPERVAGAKAQLGRWTNLRPDFGRLTDEEGRRLLELVKKAATSEESQPGAAAFNPDRLAKRDRARLEALVERAAGVEAGTFERERQAKAARAEVEKVWREGLVNNPTREAEGRFFKEVRRQLTHPDGTCLTADHLAVLTGVLAIIFSASPPRSSTATVEQDAETGETVLFWPRNHSLFGVADGRELPGRTLPLLLHLAANGWLHVVEGSTLRISLGARARRVFGKGNK